MNARPEQPNEGNTQLKTKGPMQISKPPLLPRSTKPEEEKVKQVVRFCSFRGYKHIVAYLNLI